MSRERRSSGSRERSKLGSKYAGLDDDLKEEDLEEEQEEEEIEEEETRKDSDEEEEEVERSVLPIVTNRQIDKRSSGLPPTCLKFGKYIYNKEKETYCNRSITSWCQVCSYYGLFMLIMLALFMIMIYSFLVRSKHYGPGIHKITLMKDPNPALSLVPVENSTRLAIWYDKKGQPNGRYEMYVNDIDHYLKGQDFRCKQAQLLKWECLLDLTTLGPCNEFDFGYADKKPCVLLKLNNLIDWFPYSYTKESIPQDIPDKLKEKIISEIPRRCVYINCHGETNYDRAHLNEILYYPESAFDQKYFPAKHETITNPTVALKFDSIDAGYALTLRCTLLAPNIKNYRNSMIKFVLYVDEA